MRKTVGARLLVALAISALTPLWAEAVPFTVEGNSIGAPDAIAVGELTLVGNTLSFSLDNTSTFDTRVTGVGFDLIDGDFTANNSSGLDGFAGANVGAFIFSDAALGNVPQFNDAVLDFGFVTGNSGSFAGGSPNDGLSPGGGVLNFSVTGDFLGLTDEQLASRIFVRFQRVGENGEGSDVGQGTPDEPDEEGGGEEEGGNVPEPATLLLFGTAAAACAYRLRYRG